MSVGCYPSLSSCDNSDVFVETGLTSAQCTSAATAHSMSVRSVSLCGIACQVFSSTSMTVEICLQICVTTYGYSYAGIVT